MDTNKLEELKRALRRQWEAEQEIARIEKEMLTPTLTTVAHVPRMKPTPPSTQDRSTTVDEGNASISVPPTAMDRSLSIPKRVLEIFNANPTRAITSGEISKLLSDANAATVRSAVNKMVGNEIERAKDSDGIEKRNHYMIRRSSDD